MDLWFEGITRPIRLTNGAVALLPYMKTIISSWPFHDGPSGDDEPVIAIAGGDGGFARAAPRLKSPKIYTDPVDAVCDFIVDLVHAYNDDHADLLCLHSAAVEIGGRLVVFPSGYNQGKSTFMALLAQNGLQVFCDDVMPLDIKGMLGHALGILPRLRVPIPEALGAGFSAFVVEHAGPSSRQFQYLKLRSGQLAPHGATSPIGGIVILERNESGPDTLSSATQADALKAIILRNFADAMPGMDILDGLHSVIEQAELYRLTYSSGDGAIRLLREAFESDGREVSL